MKKLLLVLVMLVLGLSTASAHYPPPVSGGVSFGVFYSSLSPHGEWIYIDGGVYAWRPVRIYDGWRPYTVGRWVWTDYGWYWVSEEPWSWATYHYGRWYYDDYWGWVWVPGYEWAPAWVEWRYGGDYIGWAPLAPYAVFSVRVGIYYTTRWVTPHYYWNFVDCRYVTSPSIHRHIYRTESNTRYIGNTRSAGSVRYDRGRIVTAGPDREFVERTGRVRLERADVVDASDRQRERVVRSDGRERIEVYRPQIERGRSNNGAERPDNVRQSERRINLDTKRIDIRAREQGPSRDADVRESGRTRSNREATQGETPQRIEKRYEVERAPTDDRSQQAPSQDRRVERKREDPRPRESAVQREQKLPQRQEQGVQQQRQEERSRVIPREEKRDDRSKREGVRSSTPDRKSRQPEGRPEQKKQESRPRPDRRGR